MENNFLSFQTVKNHSKAGQAVRSVTDFLIGKSTMAFSKGQLWHVLKS